MVSSRHTTNSETCLMVCKIKLSLHLSKTLLLDEQQHLFPVHYRMQVTFAPNCPAAFISSSFEMIELELIQILKKMDSYLRVDRCIGVHLSLWNFGRPSYLVCTHDTVWRENYFMAIYNGHRFESSACAESILSIGSRCNKICIKSCSKTYLNVEW